MTARRAQALVLSNPERPGRERTDHANIDPRRHAVHPRGNSTREAERPRVAASRSSERAA